MKEVTTIGIDLAKNVFQLHGVDAAGTVVLGRQLRRRDVVAFFGKLRPCLVGMEACGSAHHWARVLAELGHTVRLMPPRYVKAYVKRGSTDATDAEAICEAVTRPSMRFVTVKTIEQQSVLMLHRARDLLIGQRTQSINAVRAHLAETGIIAAPGREGIAALMALVKDHEDNRLSAVARLALAALVAMIESLGERIAGLDSAIRAVHRSSPTSLRLESIPGVGPLLASAVVATVGDGRAFRSGRAFSAWTGLTPRIEGTGGRTTTGRITKQGERHLRRLLVLGATSILAQARRHPGKHPAAAGLLARLDFKQAAVALANKMARTIWALLVRGGTYAPGHQPLASARRV